MNLFIYLFTFYHSLKPLLIARSFTCLDQECFGLEGMMNTAGLSPRASRQERAIKDATAVKRLKDAGL